MDKGMLKGFKKVGSTKSHTIFEHEDGHMMHISHSGLDKKLKKEMKDIPTRPVKMAKGGEVYDPSKPLVDFSGFGDFFNRPNQQIEQAIEHQQAPVQQQPAQQAPAPENYQMPQAAAPQQGSAAADPYGTEAYYGSMERGLTQQRQGIQGEAAAVGQQAAGQQAALSKGAQDIQNFEQEHQRHYEELNNERNSFIQDYQAGHIDPQRYLGKLDTGQKVATAIGLILGGIGSGVTGGANPVMKFLDDQIDRDIAAQRMDMDKKHNLLSANMQQFGNVKDAEQMTKLNMMDVLKTQLQMAEAKAQSPLAKAKAQQALGELDQKAAPILSQLTARKALLSGSKSGSISPEMVIRFTVPPERQKEVTDDLQKAQEMKQAGSHAMQVYDQLDQAFLGGALTPGRKEALIQPVIASLSKASAGRFTEMEGKAFTNLMPAAGDTTETRRIKRENLQHLLTEKMHFPALTEFGIPIPALSPVRPNANVPSGYKK